MSISYLNVAVDSAETDERYTPKWLLDLILEFNLGAIAYDPCSPPSNPTGALTFHTQEVNGLKQSWLVHSGVRLSTSAPYSVLRGLTYVNPPYSRGLMVPWCDKVIDEALCGVEILMLTQGDSSTGWYKTLRLNMDCRANLERRVTFMEPTPKGIRPCKGGAKFPSTLWYWGPRRRRFEWFWSKHAEVTQGLGPR